MTCQQVKAGQGTIALAEPDCQPGLTPGFFKLAEHFQTLGAG